MPCWIQYKICHLISQSNSLRYSWCSWYTFLLLRQTSSEIQSLITTVSKSPWGCTLQYQHEKWQQYGLHLADVLLPLQSIKCWKPSLRTAMDREMGGKEGFELGLLCYRVLSEPTRKEDWYTLGKGNAHSPSPSHSHHRWHQWEINLLVFPNSAVQDSPGWAIQRLRLGYDTWL